MASGKCYVRRDQSRVLNIYFQESNKKKILVVPTSLQMAWTLYPAYFGIATEIARYMEEQYSNSPVGEIPPHPLWIQTILANGINLIPDTNKREKGESKKIPKILEDFVGNFINICEPKLEEHLLHLSWELLHWVHTVFPPLSVTKYVISDPI